MSLSLRSRPSKEEVQNNASDTRVRHRNNHGASPTNGSSSLHVSPQHQQRTALTINTEFNGFPDRLSNNTLSPVYTTLASPKLHGRRAVTFERFKRTNKHKMVLGGSFLVLTFCMAGVWMSSNDLQPVDPARRHRAPIRYNSSGKNTKVKTRERTKPERKKERVMELYRPLPDRRAIKKPVRRKKEEDAQWGERKDTHVDQQSDEREGDSSREDDYKGNIPFLVPSSHVDSPSRDVDMRMFGYVSKPRVLHCDFQPLIAEQQFGDVNDATLKAVNRLPAHETKQLLSSERYVSLYPDDDELFEKIDEVKRNSKKYRAHKAEPFETEECKAKYDWQNGAFPNCNNVHELELGQLIGMHGRAIRDALNLQEGDGDEQVRYWAHGYWRDVWLVSKAVSSQEEIGVLKTLRKVHDFTDRNYDRHRKDALASERLSKSPNVVDIYAFCSNSAVFEYGDAGDIDVRIWPYDKKAKKHYVAELSTYEKIDIAYQIARAIADIHDVEEDGLPSIVHTDITPTQFIMIDGRYKVNDFNRCRFMRVNTTDNSECGFKVGMNPGKFRAPEEYNYEIEDEKVDIYSMGNIFYSILSGNMPFEDIKEKEAQKLVKEGERPEIPDDVLESEDVAVKAILSVIKRCWEQDPKDRPTASEVRDEFKKLMDKMPKPVEKDTDDRIGRSA